MEIRDRVDARKSRYGEREALELAATVDEIITMRGAKTTHLDMRSKPGRSEVLGALLGPTGNLRAPTIRRGRTLLVGFSPTVFEEHLG